MKASFSIAFSLDESTDVTDVTQLAIFIRGVDASLTVTDEFVELVPMTDTITAKTRVHQPGRCTDKLEVDWSRGVALSASQRTERHP